MVGMGRTFVERWPSPPKMRHQLVPEHHHDRTELPLIMPSGLPPRSRGMIQQPKISMGGKRNLRETARSRSWVSS